MKKLLALFLAASIALGATACQSSTPQPSAQPSQAAAPAPQGGQASAPSQQPAQQSPAASSRDTLFVSLKSVGNTLDMAVANATNTTIMTNHIYDYIIGVDENFNFVPGVAKEWKQIDDLTWELTIGDGFVFHNGEALKLDDVVYSIERLRNVPKRASIMENIASTEITGDKNVTIKLVKPNSSTIKSLMGAAHVYNKAYCESVGEDYANKPIGTGPYVATSFVPGDKLVLTAWKDYPFEKPFINEITFKGIEEDASRFISLETSEAQFATIHYLDYERAKGNDKINAIESQTTNIGFISMNNTKAPFDNKNIRLAMAYAVDKDSLAAVKGGARVIDSMVPSMFGSYYSSPDVPKYDLEKARQLLEAEGYNASKPLTFEAWIYGGANPVMEAYQAVLKTIGVEMSIKNLEFGVFLEGMAKGEYQMLEGSWNNVTGDPLTAIEVYSSKSFGMQNIAFYNNPRCDELYEKSVAAKDEKDINEAAKEIQQIGAENMPIIPTFSNSAFYGMDKSLKDVVFYPSNIFSFKKARFE